MGFRFGNRLSAAPLRPAGPGDPFAPPTITLPAATFSDDFPTMPTLPGAFWEAAFGTVTVASGQLRVTADPEFSGLDTLAGRTFTYASVQIPAAANQWTYLKVKSIAPATGGNYAQIVIDSTVGLIRYERYDNNVAGAQVEGYDATAHRYVAIYQNAGQLYWLSSAAGAVWTIERQDAAPSWATDPMTFELGAGGDATTGVALFDTFRAATGPVVPVPPPAQSGRVKFTVAEVTGSTSIATLSARSNLVTI